MSFEHRRTNALVTLTTSEGQPLAHRDVTVRQVRHEFEFGCTGFGIDVADPALQEAWLGLFDTATLPVYWGRYEPTPGATRKEQLAATARWLDARDIRLKGHPLVWHTVKPRWLDVLPIDEAERLLRARIRREVGNFAGLIDTWDVINEVVIMPQFTNEPDGVRNAVTRICAARGRVGMVRLAVDEARGPGTSPRLVLNDFDLGPEYEQLVEDVLAAGIEIDAIGLQSHMHKGFRGEGYLLEVSDRFARFGLPLHWTETTMLSGDPVPHDVEDLNDHIVDDWPGTPEGEERQADEIVRHYTTLVGHPAVRSITYWGLGDSDSWLNAPAGLLRRDNTPKPAYHALRDLVRGQWWIDATPTRTDEAGRVAVNGFAGRYRVDAGASSALVDLTSTTARLGVVVR